jgi:hypothetical protein
LQTKLTEPEHVADLPSKGRRPAAFTISNAARASPPSSRALAMRKASIRRSIRHYLPEAGASGHTGKPCRNVGRRSEPEGLGTDLVDRRLRLWGDAQKMEGALCPVTLDRGAPKGETQREKPIRPFTGVYRTGSVPFVANRASVDG